jgi:hypothetical protein
MPYSVPEAMDCKAGIWRAAATGERRRSALIEARGRNILLLAYISELMRLKSRE